MTRVWRKTAALFGVAALVTAVFVTAGGAGARPTATAGLAAYPRGQTLYTSGTMWSPYSDLNPFKTWDYVTGTQGLVYEHLFNYDPLTDKFTPWLATRDVVEEERLRRECAPRSRLSPRGWAIRSRYQ